MSQNVPEPDEPRGAVDPTSLPMFDDDDPFHDSAPTPTPTPPITLPSTGAGIDTSASRPDWTPAALAAGALALGAAALRRVRPETASRD